jgi:hypothetical protein
VVRGSPLISNSQNLTTGTRCPEVFTRKANLHLLIEKVFTKKASLHLLIETQRHDSIAAAPNHPSLTRPAPWHMHCPSVDSLEH